MTLHLVKITAMAAMSIAAATYAPVAFGQAGDAKPAVTSTPPDALAESQQGIAQLRDLFAQSLARIQERNEAIKAKKEQLGKITDDVDQTLGDLKRLRDEASEGGNLVKHLNDLRAYAKAEGAKAMASPNPNIRKYAPQWQTQADRADAARKSAAQLEKDLGDQIRTLTDRRGELEEQLKLKEVDQMNSLAEQSLGDLTAVLNAAKAKVDDMDKALKAAAPGT